MADAAGVGGFGLVDIHQEKYTICGRSYWSRGIHGLWDSVEEAVFVKMYAWIASDRPGSGETAIFAVEKSNLKLKLEHQLK